MTTILFLSAVAILVLYTAFLTIRYGVLPSFSDSYYALGKFGFVFQLVLGLIASLMMIVMFNLTFGLWWQFLSFLVPGPLLFVSAAPRFKTKGLERNTHKYAAFLSGGLSIIWVFLIAPFAWLNIGYAALIAYVFYLLDNKRNRIWWAEYAAFGWLMLSVGMAISWR